MSSKLSLKRKQPGDMPPRPPPPSSINILSEEMVYPPVAQPQVLEAAGKGEDGLEQVVNEHRQLSLPVLHVSERDFEAVNPDVMAFLEELEKTMTQDPPAPQPIGGSGDEGSNLEPDGGADHSSQYSIPFVPPLLSPLPANDVDDVEFINEPTSSSSSSHTMGATSNNTSKKNKYPPKKRRERKKSAPILRGALQNNSGCTSRQQETRYHGSSISNDSEFDCFSQSSERDVLKETAKIYRNTKEVVEKGKSSIEGIDTEIKKLKKRLAYLEEKKRRHQKNLDRDSWKLRAVEGIFRLD